jgi:hypothetical protein
MAGYLWSIACFIASPADAANLQSLADAQKLRDIA